jgi:hypothetical protein
MGPAHQGGRHFCGLTAKGRTAHSPAPSFPPPSGPISLEQREGIPPG